MGNYEITEFYVLSILTSLGEGDACFGRGGIPLERILRGENQLSNEHKLQNS
jgi:hypothetical protein